MRHSRPCIWTSSPIPILDSCGHPSFYRHTPLSKQNSPSRLHIICEKENLPNQLKFLFRRTLQISIREKMNLFLFQLLPLVSFLAHVARCSALPAQRLGPQNPSRRICHTKFGDPALRATGTCQEPNDSYQCEDRMTANTKDCGKGRDGRWIHCCILLACNSRWSGTCRNNFKNCNGEWTVS